MEMRLTPCERSSFALSNETVAGLHSTVHSAAPSKSRRSMALNIVSHCRRFSSDGVPPPKKTVRGLRSGAINSNSRTSALTYRLTSSPFEGSEKNAQYEHLCAQNGT